jgi:hypothetical protein
VRPECEINRIGAPKRRPGAPQLTCAIKNGAFQASQSLFTLRQTRVLDTAPPNRARSTRRADSGRNSDGRDRPERRAGGEELPAQGALRSRQSGADGRQARPVPGQSLHLGHYTCNGAVETTRLLRGPSPDNILFPRSDGAMQNRHSAASANCEPAMCIIRPAPASFKNLI